jgi:nitrous oxidase accessory protein NosD
MRAGSLRSVLGRRALFVIAATVTLVTLWARPAAVADAPIVVAQGGGGTARTIAEGLELAGYGDTILVRPGTYVESFVIDEDIRLMGDGHPGEIVITAPQDGPVTSITIFGLRPRYAVLLDDTRAIVSGVTFRGASSAVVVLGGTPRLVDLTFDHVGEAYGRAMEGTHEAIAIVGGGATVFDSALIGGGGISVSDRSDARIEGNILTDGAHIWGRFGDRAIVRSNRISGMLVRAVATHASGTVTIEDNTISGAGAEGIVIGLGDGPGSEAIVRDNVISGTTTAIHARAGSLATIEHNVLVDNGVGIFMAGGASGTISVNDLVDNEIGIAVSRSDVRVDDNGIRGGVTGMVVTAGGTPTFERNVVEGAARGVVIDLGASPVLVRNRICATETNLSVADGADSILVDNTSCEPA